MSNRLQKACLSHARYYTNEFVDTMNKYAEGHDAIEGLMERVSEVLPQVSTAYLWCQTTSSCDGARQLSDSIEGIRKGPPPVATRDVNESRRWANLIDAVAITRTESGPESMFLQRLTSEAAANAAIRDLRDQLVRERPMPHRYNDRSGQLDE